ncbi:hypothetical protein ACOMHN_007068 [Nucella lapillus]
MREERKGRASRGVRGEEKGESSPGAERTLGYRNRPRTPGTCPPFHSSDPSGCHCCCVCDPRLQCASVSPRLQGHSAPLLQRPSAAPRLLLLLLLPPPSSGEPPPQSAPSEARAGQQSRLVLPQCPSAVPLTVGISNGNQKDRSSVPLGRDSSSVVPVPKSSSSVLGSVLPQSFSSELVVDSAQAPGGDNALLGVRDMETAPLCN